MQQLVLVLQLLYTVEDDDDDVVAILFVYLLLILLTYTHLKAFRIDEILFQILLNQFNVLVNAFICINMMMMMMMKDDH